jgi:uncharacterized damage-inducible protein DinB
MVEPLSDPRRVDPPLIAVERAMLEAWLEFHRTTLLLKCEGLDDAGRKARPVPTSVMSLHGLVRHMAGVEWGWFHQVLLEDPEAPSLFYDPALGEDSDFVPLDDADWESDVAAWQAECENSRKAAAGHALDDTGTKRDQQYSLRWIYVHMIEEYARHNGHADLIREMIDGSVGD